MKIFMKILGAFAAFILIISAIGFIFFPSHIHVERSIVIDRDKAGIFNYLNELRNQPSWSPWHEKDINTKYIFSEPSSGVGAEMKWDSPVKDVGKGSMKNTKVVSDSLIKMDLNFMDNGTAQGAYTFSSEGKGTKVVWSLDMEAGANPLFRIMGKFMDGMVGKDFEKGLIKLKAVQEAMPVGPVTTLEESAVPESNYLSFHGKADVANIATFLGNSYGLIGAELGKQKLKMSGAPFAFYYTNSSTAWEMDAAIPTATLGKSNGTIKAGKISAGNAVCVHYFGSYDKISKAHSMAHDYISAHNKTIIGAPWESYITDPGVEKDTLKWQTDVFYPIK